MHSRTNKEDLNDVVPENALSLSLKVRNKGFPKSHRMRKANVKG